MRLLSLSLRNYRVHRELDLDFDPARNLVGGPNESGKSTLAEAAHRALFLRAKTGGGVQAEMVSTLHHGSPEVRLAFEAAGTRWEVEKRFAGAKGSARLGNAAGAVFKDDEAETKLSELLRCEVDGTHHLASHRLRTQNVRTVRRTESCVGGARAHDGARLGAPSDRNDHRKDDVIVIHVCDDNRRINRDFYCSRELLLQVMSSDDT